jgi:hypothetical protein
MKDLGRNLLVFPARRVMLKTQKEYWSGDTSEFPSPDCADVFFTLNRVQFVPVQNAEMF